MYRLQTYLAARPGESVRTSVFMPLRSEDYGIAAAPMSQRNLGDVLNGVYLLAYAAGSLLMLFGPMPVRSY